MSGGTTKTTQQQSSTTSNAVDPRQLQMLEENYRTAQANGAELKPYSGPLTAPFNDTQRQAQAMLAGIAGDRSGQAMLANAGKAVQGMLGYRPPSLSVERIAAPQVAAPGRVSGSDALASLVTAQPKVTAARNPAALAPPQNAVTAGTMAAATVMPQAAVAAPGIEAAIIGREAPVAATRIRAGQLAETDLSPYLNPYQKAVVDSSIADNARARSLAVAANARKASAANAFGGSRSAVLDALTNEGYDRNNATALANLNAANYAQAREAAETDINRRFTADQFNEGNRLNAETLNANLGQAAALANQAALNSARSQNAANEFAAGQFNANLGQAAALANQAAENDAARFNVENRLTADTLNANLGQQTALANQNAQNEMARFDAGNTLAAETLNANLGQQAALANQNAGNETARLNADRRLTADTLNANLAQQAGLANQNSEMAARQFNAEGARAASQADINNALAAYGLTLNAAGQLVSLGNAGLADATSRAGLLAGVGDAQQALDKAGMEAAYQEYLRQQGFGAQRQQMLNSSLGLIPIQQTTTANSSGSGTEKTGGGFMGILGGLGALGQGLGAAGLSLSDRDLKADIRTLRHDKHGRRWVSFRYLWEPQGVRHEGVLAQELLNTDPHAVHLGRDGFYRVDYGMLEAQ